MIPPFAPADPGVVALMEFGWMTAVLAVGAVGLLLLVIGLRGRRVGDHPHCRKCGFDLYGLDAFSALCPECGADRTGKRAVRIGKRRRRPIIATLGAVLLLASLATTSAVLWGRATQFDWNTIKPTWMLLQEARFNDAAVRDPALAELLARDTAGTLRADTRSEVLGLILDMQADPAIAWRDEWGDAIHQAHLAGNLDDADFKRFLEQAVLFELDVRPQVRTGERLPIWLRFETRAWSNPGLWLKSERQSLRVAETEYVRRGWGGYGRSMLGGAAGLGNTVTVDEPPGEYTLRARWRMSLTRDDPNDEMRSWNVELTAPVRITGDSGDPITMVPDAGLRAEIIEKTSVTAVRFDESVQRQRRMYDTTVYFRDLPVNVGFDVFWRVGEREWFLGRAALGAARHHGFALSDRLEGFPDDVDQVTVILRASAEAARLTTDLTEIWNGELVFENVPIERR